jgi:uncharacterized protein
MLFLLSPAKALDFETPAHTKTHTQPLFVEQAAALIALLREKTPLQVSALMDLSDQLAGLNVARYQAWQPKFTAKNSKQAVLAFDGDVYGGLDAKTLSEEELGWLQQHLCILSGLYGVLRPLDRMQPYRLEMGTRLQTEKGSNLYRFWGSQVADYLNQRARADKSPVVINLASDEYFKVVDRKALKPRVVTCVFEERKGDTYKIVSFFAKRARGLMVRYALQQRAVKPEQLQGFDLEGYRFAPAVSDPDRLVFRREQKTAGVTAP